LFRLLSFLSEYRNVLLFLALEIVALILVVRYNDRQRHAFGDAVLERSAKLQAKRAEWDHYFLLDDENLALMRENIQLRKQVSDLKKRVNIYEGEMLRDSIHWVKADSLISQEAYGFLPCRAIRNSTSRNYNYITIDKGSNHGVNVGMGIVSARHCGDGYPRERKLQHGPERAEPQL